MCYTKSEKCIFPFIFRGVTYYKCTNKYDPYNKYWCSTNVNSQGIHIQGYWGYCNNIC